MQSKEKIDPLTKAIFSPNRLPIIRQSEAAECGLACLAMISTYHGQAFTLSELRRKFSTSLKGTTLRTIMDMADSIGLSSRPIRLEIESLRSLKCPALLHWDLKHFVVLKKISGRKVWIHDPARGLRGLSIEELSKSFTGVAVEFTATPAFVPRKQIERTRLSDLFSRMKGVIPSVAQIFLLAAILEAFNVLMPMLNQLIVDDVIGRGDNDLLVTVAFGMAGLMVVTTLTSTLQSFVGLYLGTQLSFQMQTNLLRQLFRLPVSWFERRTVGDIMSRFNSLVPVQDIFTNSFKSITLSSFTAAVSLVMMILYMPTLAVLEALTVLFFFVVRGLTFPYYRERTIQGLLLSARVQSVFFETLRGMATFKAFGRERERLALWQNEVASAMNNTVQVSRFSTMGGAGLGILAGVQQIIVWFMGASLVINGHATLGMLFAFQAYTSQFSGASSTLVGQFFLFKSINIHLDRLSDIVQSDAEGNIDEPVDNARRVRGELSVRDLSFRYAEHEPWILRNVSLDIAAGDCVCFTGPSGQGKSTLIKILLGFYDPQEGEVMIDGVRLRTFGIRTYRARIGVVMQDDKLFAGTIADNIAFFDPEIDMDKVEAAAMAAHVRDDITSLPMGYMTFVGDMGSTLSGGQKQRIFLARALYNDPSILFLDEGTANLDQVNEARILDSLRDLKITRVYVAHRAAAIADANRVFDVSNKKIVETTLAAPMLDAANN